MGTGETSTSAAGIGWYVHLPFCTTKCGYCDFYSLPTLPHLVDDLVRALAREMDDRDPKRPVETIFVGGGTPTVLPAEALEAILRGIVGHSGLVAEFTVEANPSSTDELKLELLRRCGVNRVSFGAQSFNPDELRILERIHDPVHIFESVAAARSVGFDNINLDLIYGIPGQTLAAWHDTLRKAIDLGTEHLSCYALMYEPGTSMTKLRVQGRIVACDENIEADMFEATIDTLSAAGFEHYEISNFARPGRRCAANILYWENREYLGVGPSAVSYLNGLRRKNIADVRRYVDGMVRGTESIIAEEERLDEARRFGETAIQMLRLTDGIDFARFRALTGGDMARVFATQMAEFVRMGLAVCDERGFRLTRRGMLVSNRVMEEFLAMPAANSA